MNVSGHSTDKLEELRTEIELEGTQLNKEIVIWREGTEKRLREDEEKFCTATSDSTGDYLKVTVLPMPNIGSVNTFQVHSNVWLKSTNEFEVLY